jgi:hypothetical protein
MTSRCSKPVTPGASARQCRRSVRCGTLNGVPNIYRQVIHSVATDDRGFIYIIDRDDTGLHILRLTAKAAKIVGLHGDGD